MTLYCIKHWSDNYWMNQIGTTADNSSTNKQVRIDNWRPDIGPRIINVEKHTDIYLVSEELLTLVGTGKQLF